MTLTWAETKKVIRELLAPVFVNAGFPNPGVAMWRWRVDFVDVLFFYHRSNSNFFSVELGCHPRNISSPHPEPWNCIFRSRVHVPDISPPIYGDNILFTESVDELRQTLVRSAPFILDYSLMWWSQFSTIENANDLLVNSSDANLNKIGVGIKGSVAYQENLAAVKSLLKAR
jgi:hypothetical protein